MQTVLGLSVTATNVQTVLVEGCDADGITLEHDAFDVFSGAESPIHASEQVAEAVAAPPPRKLVVKAGRIVARDGRITALPS